MVLPNKFLSYLHLNSKLCDLGLKNKPKFLDTKAEGWSDDVISNNLIAFRHYQTLIDRHSDWRH